MPRGKKKVVEAYAPPPGMSLAQAYAKPRKWGVLSKKEGEEIVELFNKVGFTVSVQPHDGFTIIRVRHADRFVIDTASDGAKHSPNARMSEE